MSSSRWAEFLRHVDHLRKGYPIDMTPKPNSIMSAREAHARGEAREVGWKGDALMFFSVLYDQLAYPTKRGKHERAD